jgi:hypothetical protein
VLLWSSLVARFLDKFSALASFTMLLFISFLFAFLVYVLPARCVSTVQFFSDKNCQKSIGSVNGTDDGACHPAIATDASTKLVSLDPNCAGDCISSVGSWLI